MIAIDLNNNLGFVPLTIAGAKIGASTVSAVTSVIPNLLQNKAWKNIGGELSQLHLATDQVNQHGNQLVDHADQLINKLRTDIQNNVNTAQYHSVQNTSTTSQASLSNTVLLVVLALGGGAFILKQKGLI